MTAAVSIDAGLAELAGLESTASVLLRMRDQWQTRQRVGRHEVQISMEQFGVDYGPYKLGAFTAEPSAAGLTVAMESMGNRIREVFRTILAKLKELIKRVVVEIRNYYDSIRSSKDAEKVKDMPESVRNAQELIDAVEEYQDAQLSALAHRVKHRLEVYETWSVLDFDLLQDGKYTQAMRSLADPIKELLRRLSVTADDLDRVEDAQEMRGRPEIYRDVVSLPIPAEVSRLVKGEGFMDTIARLVHLLDMESETESTDHPVLHNMPAQLRKNPNLTKPLNPHMDKIRGQLLDMERLVEKASLLDTRSEFSEAHAKETQEGLRLILDAATSVRLYVTWCGRLQHYRSQRIDFLHRYVTDIIKLTSGINARQ